MDLQSVLDLVRTVVAAMAEKVREAEDKAQNPFLNRTNIYRCEDGRPICYCCLRVGHVAKYCWDRRYSCPHTSFVEPPAPDPSLPNGPLDVDSLGRDVRKLLKELQGITHDLELSRTTPIRVDDIRWTREDGAEKASEHCKESLAVNPDADVKGPRRHLCSNFGRPRIPKCHSVYTASGLMDFRDVT